MPFEEIDEDLQENSEQVISTTEKALITLALGFVKLIAWRVKRAKTYGDLYNIVRFFKAKADKLEEKYEGVDDEKANAPEIILEELTKMKDDLEEENENIFQDQPRQSRFTRFLS